MATDEPAWARDVPSPAQCLPRAEVVRRPDSMRGFYLMLLFVVPLGLATAEGLEALDHRYNAMQTQTPAAPQPADTVRICNGSLELKRLERITLVSDGTCLRIESPPEYVSQSPAVKP